MRVFYLITSVSAQAVAGPPIILLSALSRITMPRPWFCLFLCRRTDCVMLHVKSRTSMKYPSLSHVWSSSHPEILKLAFVHTAKCLCNRLCRSNQGMSPAEQLHARLGLSKASDSSHLASPPRLDLELHFTHRSSLLEEHTLWLNFLHA